MNKLLSISQISGCILGVLLVAPSYLRSEEIQKSSGDIVSVKLENKELEIRSNKKLVFCVFENGLHDLMFVGCRIGMWSQGEFDLSKEDSVIYTGKVDHLLYSGRIINMGDVIDEQPKNNYSLHITRIAGIFK